MLLRKYNVAVVGPTGMVGQEFLKVLEQLNFPMASITLFASDRVIGKKMFVNHREAEVKALTPRAFDPIDIALFSSGPDVSMQFAPIAVKRGAVVIDNSSAWRLNPKIPLVVPEVNPQDLANHQGLIANPDAITTQTAMVLWPLHKVNPIKRVTATALEAVSGTGGAAVEELSIQSKAVLEGRSVAPHVFHHQIAFNMLPEIDVFLDDGYTKEEWKLGVETQKIMHDDKINISATCVRVPVYVGHSASFHVEFSQQMSPDEARKILSGAPGVKVLDDPAVSLYPHPWAVAGTNAVYVGRIRRDSSCPNGLVMWVVADNIRKGAALNAVQIAEELVNRGLL